MSDRPDRHFARLRRLPGWATWTVSFALVIALATRGLGGWQTFAACFALGLGAALVAIRRERAPTAQHLRALSTLVAAWSDADFATSIREPGDPDLLELTRTLNALGGQLRDERARLVQRELLLDTVVQNTPTALLLTDPRERVVYGNLAARELFGVPGKLEGFAFEDLVGRLPEALAEPLRAGQDGLVTLSVEGEEDVFHLTRRSFELHGRRHQLTMLRRLTRELARQEVATWKKVIRVISHELNNALGPIASMAHTGRVYAERGDKDKLRKIFATIDERARHLEAFIGGYARFAKLPAPRLLPVPWEALLDSVTQAQAVRVLHPLPEAHAHVDRAQVEQALINLVKNAVEAGSPPEQVEIAVQDAGPMFLLQVRDRGSGMSETVLEQALLPFYSTKRAGTGLGLALAREIAEAHGGRIRLANRPDGGLAVSLWLPKPQR
ncbi:MAG: PAS domain-containing protein [Xanthomonadales bacterium]|nr:Adaptive-response sensory-kinase SasA [Xanthomonadales bacterium]MCC6592157.1 PAS domain-containing protein [Xanthomonadales bacterium]MCE7931153.1 PAS domain-containing protein [Xanthomonadales bacterium PRO6]